MQLNRGDGGDGGTVVSAGPVSAQLPANFAVTGNFARFPQDISKQFAMAYQFYPEEFQAKAVPLENIVYYRSPLAHYMVATIKNKTTLLQRGVLKENRATTRELLNRDNVDRGALEAMVTDMGKEWGIPLVLNAWSK